MVVDNLPNPSGHPACVCILACLCVWRSRWIESIVREVEVSCSSEVNLARVSGQSLTCIRLPTDTCLHNQILIYFWLMIIARLFSRRRSMRRHIRSDQKKRKVFGRRWCGSAVASRDAEPVLPPATPSQLLTTLLECQCWHIIRGHIFQYLLKL